MSQTFRHPDILEIARKEGKVMVEDLAERFNVTVQTIRRDLTEMAHAGKLERVHGGAVLPSGVDNIRYEERRQLNMTAKDQVAQGCAAHIPNDASVFLNIGTSTEAVARALRGHSNLMVMTNNINVANILSGNSDCEVIVTGGALRKSDGGLVGPLTMRSVETFKFDIAVIGCSALDAEGDILDFDMQEVGVSQTILRRARQSFLVADQSKFERSAPVAIGSLREIDMFFTDAYLPGDLAVQCREWSTEVVVV
ncbi:MAG: DeoR/GlpR family DNA-binding transcription regulator [Pseudomonadota bacterium]